MSVTVLTFFIRTFSTCWIAYRLGNRNEYSVLDAHSLQWSRPLGPFPRGETATLNAHQTATPNDTRP